MEGDRLLLLLLLLLHRRHRLSGKSGNTHELLMELSDDEVIEWCADIFVKRERLRAKGQEFGSWMLSNALSVGDWELGRRGYSWQAIHDAIDERIGPESIE